MELSAAVEDLYGGALDDFIATRKELAAQARSAGNRVLATQITALRKPSLAAWAINVVARGAADALGEFAQLAAELRDAQARLDGAEMRRLSRSREPMLDRLEAHVVDVAADEGVVLTPAVIGQVRASFVAAIADARAQEAVLSGNLTRALSYAGLGEVDLTQATAAPVPTGRADSRPADSRPAASGSLAASDTGSSDAESLESTAPSDAAERDEAQRARAARRRVVQRAQDRLADAERELTAASLKHAQAEQEARRTAARLREIERLLERAGAEADAARATEATAAVALDDAHSACDEAREELDALTAADPTT